MSITAAQVKSLRERTGAGMMECKKALVETNGDIEKAIEMMRKSGQAKADKKADRVAAEGLSITSEIELCDRFVARDPLLRQIVLAIYRESIEPTPPNRLYLESLQNTLMLHLLRHHCHLKTVEPNLNSGLSSSQLQKIIEYIDANLSQDLKLTELAQVINVSPPHFGRLFKQSLGISPHQYVLQRRIKKAKTLLVQGKLPVKQIVQTLGFYDQSHFSRVFRKYVGVTPKQYQKRS